MGFLFKKMRTIKNDEIQEKLKPYEQREKIQPLVMVVTIISREQSRYYLDAYQELGASLSLVFYSYSMPPEEYRNILGSDSTKKEIILTLVRGDLRSLERAKESASPVRSILFQGLQLINS